MNVYKELQQEGKLNAWVADRIHDLDEADLPTRHQDRWEKFCRTSERYFAYLQDFLAILEEGEEYDEETKN